MEELTTLYLVMVPVVIGAGLLEALWQQRTRAEG